MPRRSERGIGEVVGNQADQRLGVMSGTRFENAARLPHSYRPSAPMSLPGTKRTCRAELTMPVDGGNAEVGGKQSN
jgi:hypothetical protein